MGVKPVGLGPMLLLTRLSIPIIGVRGTAVKVQPRSTGARVQTTPKQVITLRDGHPVGRQGTIRSSISVITGCEAGSDADVFPGGFSRVISQVSQGRVSGRIG